jgi:hypothetical protein
MIIAILGLAPEPFYINPIMVNRNKVIIHECKQVRWNKAEMFIILRTHIHVVVFIVLSSSRSLDLISMESTQDKECWRNERSQICGGLLKA